MDGSVTCEVDDDTTYSAGTGLRLTGTTFSVDTSAVQARVTGTCPVGQAIRAIGMDGSVTCEADDDTTYTAGPGLTLAGTTFAVNTAAIQSRVTGTCSAGQAIRAIGMDGSVTCEAVGVSPSVVCTVLPADGGTVSCPVGRRVLFGVAGRPFLTPIACPARIGNPDWGMGIDHEIPLGDDATGSCNDYQTMVLGCAGNSSCTFDGNRTSCNQPFLAILLCI
jgi:hypothetical protein